MVSTGLGLVTVMYFAQEGFVNGFSPFLVGVIATVAHIIIGKTAPLDQKAEEMMDARQAR